MTCYNAINEQTLFLKLATCVEASLRDCGEICEFQIAPGGTPAVDSCGCDGGCDGHGWITITAGSPYQTFGNDTRTENCDSMLQVDVEAGVLRCYPVGEDSPDPQILADLSMLLIQDMMALRKGLLCCPDTDVILNEYRPVPPAGGCVGGVWRAVLSLS